MNHIKTVGIVICLFLATNLFAAGVEKKIEKSFDVAMGGTLDLDSEMGSVEITSLPDKRVTVSILLTARTSNKREAEDIFNDFELTFAKNGNDVRIEGNSMSRRLWSDSRLKVRYIVAVPQNYNLNIETHGGKINVDDIHGTVGLKTSGGSIVLGRIAGEVHAKTSGGIIRLESSTADANLRTSGGGIRIGKVNGDVEVSTSGGNIDVDVVQGNLKAVTSGGNLFFRNVNGNLIGRTSGGSIDAELTAQVNRSVELYTSGGNITLAIPADFKANLAASTFGGRVYTNLPVLAQGTISNSSLSGTINGGGPDVSLRTMGGNIEINGNVH